MRLALEPLRISRIDPAECRQLLATEHVGRLGFVTDGLPDVLPVNYVLDGDAVVFATAPGSKLWAASRSPVAFEVDHVEPASRSGWSVVVHGLAQEITSSDTDEVRERLHALALSPWPGGEHHNLIRIPTRTVTGRRIAAA